MNTTDTSREAVERLVADLDARYQHSPVCLTAASTLTALLERCEKAEADLFTVAKFCGITNPGPGMTLVQAICHDIQELRDWRKVADDVAQRAQADATNYYARMVELEAERDDLRVRLEHNDKLLGAIAQESANRLDELAAAQSRIQELEARLAVAERLLAEKVRYCESLADVHSQLTAAQSRVVELEADVSNGTSLLFTAQKNLGESQARESKLREALDYWRAQWNKQTARLDALFSAAEKARAALTWSRPYGGNTCEGTMSEHESQELHEDACDALDAALAGSAQPAERKETT